MQKREGKDEEKRDQRENIGQEEESEETFKETEEVKKERD